MLRLSVADDLCISSVRFAFLGTKKNKRQIMENTSVKGKDEATCFKCRMGVVQRGLKRFFDALGAVVAMIVFSPFFLVAYISIKMEKTGPALFKQERIGKNGKPFMLYKFRTMTTDAENGKPKLYNTGGDDRLTKVGKFLREHHLDELPQLWNVLRGEMSMVGYRPERQYFIDKIMEHDPRYVQLYQMRPGLFSEATLYNGYTDTMDKMLERLRMDLAYINKCSIWLDTKIIFLSALFILTGKKF